MEVIMTSPVQECLMMENGGGDDSAKLTKSKKRRQKKKVKLNAENPDSKRVLPHFYIISQSSLQDNPNCSLGTTASVDQKHAVSIPAAGDANTGSKREDHMETSSNKIISDKIATPDAKTMSKGEDDTKVVNGEMGSGTTPTDNTVTKKRKRQRKKKNQTSNDMVTVEKDSSKTATNDPKMVSKGEDHMETFSNKMFSETSLGTTASVDQKHTVSIPAACDANTRSKKDHMETSSTTMISGKIATPDATTVSKGEDDTKVVNGEMGPGTTAADNTVPKKRKKQRKKKNQASNDMVTVEKNSSKTATDDPKMVSKGEDHMETSTNKMISETCLGTTASVDQKHAVSIPAAGDANTGSKKEDHMETSSNTMISGKTATPDANTVSKGEEDTKVANAEMGSGTTPADNTVPKKKKKQRKKKKNQASNDMVTVDKDSTKTATDEVKMVSKGEEDTKVTNGEMVSDTTATDNTVSKKRKKNQASDDMVTVEKDSSKTVTDDVKMVSKEEDTKAVNGEMVSDTTATDNTVPKKKKSKKKKKNEASNDMLPVEKDSSKTATNDAKMESKGENHTKVTNANKGLIKTTKHYKNGRVIEQKIHRSTDKRPTLGEILHPQYLELMGPGFAKIAARGQNKKIQGKKQQVSYATMDAKRVKMESVIQTGKEKVSGTTKTGKKLLIFDINGLLADIVSPRPQDVQADYYIPKRAIFKRPYLDGFLRFCFERFNVGIWSSRTKQVLYPVVDFLLGDLKKNLLFIWDNSYCTNTGMKTLEDKYKPMVFKDLRKIWLKNGLGNSWVEGTFHESNTLLLDDSPYKALLNPKNTAIFPLSYSYKDRNDDFLGPNGDLRRYLEGLAESDDVKTYVEQHPFGQPAIDQTHPSWTFYAKALKSQK